MKKLMLILMLFSSYFISAQDDAVAYSTNHSYHSFEKNQVCKLLANNVNVRASASIKGAVVANVPIGIDLIILDQSKEVLTLKGFSSNWYKVSFEHKGKTQSGFVWGGLIADVWIGSKEDPDLIFLFGADRLIKKQDEAWTDIILQAQVRACKKNQELSKLTFKLGGGLDVSRWISSLGNKSISGVKEVLSAGASQEMCAGYYGAQIIFWNGRKLLAAAMLRPGGDAPYYSEDLLVYPSDKDGVKGKIIRKYEAGFYDEQIEEMVVESLKKVVYTWTGKALKKDQVLVDKK